MMGSLVGGTFGVIFGTGSGLSNGLRGMPLILGIGKSSIQSAAAFGFFLSIGTAVRSCGR